MLPFGVDCKHFSWLVKVFDTHDLPPIPGPFLMRLVSYTTSRELMGCQVIQRTVRPDAVVILPPCLDLIVGVGQGQERILIQAFGSEFAVERLDKRVVRRCAGATEVEFNVVEVGALIHSL
jgi:hypothetical protein